MINDMELLKFLKNEKISKNEVLLLLDISESTYDKVISPNVERKLPKKSIDLFNHILKFENQKELFLEISKNKDMIRSKIEFLKTINEVGCDALKRQQNLYLNILKSSTIRNSTDEELIYMENFFKSEKYIKLMLDILSIKGSKEVSLNRDELFLKGIKEILLNNSDLKNKIIEEGKLKQTQE